MQTTNGYLDLGDGQLYYETAGSGEPLVLSHAAFLDCRMFDELWEELAQNWQVIRYDMRGYGKSSAVQQPLCRRDDLRCLLEHLHISRAHLVGCSNGGQLLLDLALEYPQLAASLTLVGSTPSGFEMVGEPPRYILEMFGAVQQGNVEYASELQIRIYFDGSFREPDQVDAALRAKALQMNRLPVAQNTFLIADMQPLNPLQPPAVTRLEALTCPVWVVVGALDHPEILRAGEMMVKAMPRAHQTIMANTGHVPSYEQPQQFGALLKEFLQQR